MLLVHVIEEESQEYIVEANARGETSGERAIQLELSVRQQAKSVERRFRFRDLRLVENEDFRVDERHNRAFDQKPEFPVSFRQGHKVHRVPQYPPVTAKL